MGRNALDDVGEQVSPALLRPMYFAHGGDSKAAQLHHGLEWAEVDSLVDGRVGVADIEDDEDAPEAGQGGRGELAGAYDGGVCEMALFFARD